MVQWLGLSPLMQAAQIWFQGETFFYVTFFANSCWFWSHDSILLTKFHLSSLKSKKVGENVHCLLPLGSLCTLCALPVRPLCTPRAPPVQPLRTPLFDHCVRGLFEIDSEYWSTGSRDTDPPRARDTDPQNQKWVWDTDPRIFLGPFCRGHWFFQRAGREGSDQVFFLPRVPNFKSDHSGWLRHPSFYTPFTQNHEITVKDLTIVTGRKPMGWKWL